MATAQRDFKQFVQHQLGKEAGTTPAQLPFDVADLNELRQAHIAYGFPVYTVDPQDLLSGQRGMQSATVATNQWRFVIAAQGHPIGLATVEYRQGHYETVAYGAAVLAKDVDALMSVHGNADKSNLRFVRVYQAQSDVLEVRSQTDGRTRYAPLHSARASLQLAKTADADLMEEADLLPSLRTAVKANIDAAH
jgi:hypothetical protein